MQTNYPEKLKDGKTSFIVPMLLGGTQDSSVFSSSSRITRGRKLREIDSSEDDEIFDNPTPQLPDPSKNPQQKKRFRSATNHVYSSLDYLQSNCLYEELLVPIKLDFEVDDFRIQDSFTWNLNESIITPEVFAEIMCTDLDLPIGPGQANEFISESIHEQIKTHGFLVEMIKQRFTTSTQLPKKSSSTETTDNDYELRVPINIEVVSGSFVFRDQIEWDLSLNPFYPPRTKETNFDIKNSLKTTLFDELEFTKTPECFSKKLCSELGIGGEFIPLIANSIREQIFRFQKERLDLISKEEMRRIKINSSNLKQKSTPVFSRTNSQADINLNSTSETANLITKTKEGLEEYSKAEADDTQSITLNLWCDSSLFKQNALGNVFRNIDIVDDWGPSLEILHPEELEKILLGQERSRRRLRRSERNQLRTFSFNTTNKNSYLVNNFAASRRYKLGRPKNTKDSKKLETITKSHQNTSTSSNSSNSTESTESTETTGETSIKTKNTPKKVQHNLLLTFKEPTYPQRETEDKSFGFSFHQSISLNKDESLENSSLSNIQKNTDNIATVQNVYIKKKKYFSKNRNIHPGKRYIHSTTHPESNNFSIEHENQPRKLYSEVADPKHSIKSESNDVSINNGDSQQSTLENNALRVKKSLGVFNSAIQKSFRRAQYHIADKSEAIEEINTFETLLSNNQLTYELAFPLLERILDVTIPTPNGSAISPLSYEPVLLIMLRFITCPLIKNTNKTSYFDDSDWINTRRIEARTMNYRMSDKELHRAYSAHFHIIKKDKFIRILHTNIAACVFELFRVFDKGSKGSFQHFASTMDYLLTINGKDVCEAVFFTYQNFYNKKSAFLDNQATEAAYSTIQKPLIHKMIPFLSEYPIQSTFHRLVFQGWGERLYALYNSNPASPSFSDQESENITGSDKTGTNSLEQRFVQIVNCDFWSLLLQLLESNDQQTVIQIADFIISIINEMLNLGGVDVLFDAFVEDSYIVKKLGQMIAEGTEMSYRAEAAIKILNAFFIKSSCMYNQLTRYRQNLNSLDAAIDSSNFLLSSGISARLELETFVPSFFAQLVGISGDTDLTSRVAYGRRVSSSFAREEQDNLNKSPSEFWEHHGTNSSTQNRYPENTNTNGGKNIVGTTNQLTDLGQSEFLDQTTKRPGSSQSLSPSSTLSASPVSNNLNDLNLSFNELEISDNAGNQNSALTDLSYQNFKTKSLPKLNESRIKLLSVIIDILSEAEDIDEILGWVDLRVWDRLVWWVCRYPSNLNLTALFYKLISLITHSSVLTHKQLLAEVDFENFLSPDQSHRRCGCPVPSSDRCLSCYIRRALSCNCDKILTYLVDFLRLPQRLLFFCKKPSFHADGIGFYFLILNCFRLAIQTDRIESRLFFSSEDVVCTLFELDKRNTNNNGIISGLYRMFFGISQHNLSTFSDSEINRELVNTPENEEIILKDSIDEIHQSSEKNKRKAKLKGKYQKDFLNHDFDEKKHVDIGDTTDNITEISDTKQFENSEISLSPSNLSKTFEFNENIKEEKLFLNNNLAKKVECSSNRALVHDNELEAKTEKGENPHQEVHVFDNTLNADDVNSEKIFNELLSGSDFDYLKNQIRNIQNYSLSDDTCLKMEDSISIFKSLSLFKEDLNEKFSELFQLDPNNPDLPPIVNSERYLQKWQTTILNSLYWIEALPMIRKETIKQAKMNSDFNFVYGASNVLKNGKQQRPVPYFGPYRVLIPPMYDNIIVKAKRKAVHAQLIVGGKSPTKTPEANISFQKIKGDSVKTGESPENLNKKLTQIPESDLEISEINVDLETFDSRSMKKAHSEPIEDTNDFENSTNTEANLYNLKKLQFLKSKNFNLDQLGIDYGSLYSFCLGFGLELVYKKRISVYGSKLSVEPTKGHVSKRKRRRNLGKGSGSHPVSSLPSSSSTKNKDSQLVSSKTDPSLPEK
ncbi:hypothetical protein BB558_003399 [Smittium angustum]|uniref:Uncharacterized protein n=1 Tax=Smittium angustum TaxID=133377 RepID=A0A2U1J642_SMIAN|nr:hypothetical protein BB558_003399 [Smittium angustum]